MLNWLLPLSRISPRLLGVSAAANAMPGPAMACLPGWLGPALHRAGMSSLLLEPCRLWLLLPQDSALDDHLREHGLTLQAWLADGPALRAWLMEHLVTDPVRAAQDGVAVVSLGRGMLRLHAHRARTLVDAQERLVPLGTVQRLGELPVCRIPSVLSAPTRGLADLLAAHPRLGDAAQAFTACGLEVLLQASGPFTVFAPTDTAFGRLARRLRRPLQQVLGDAALMADLLARHVVPGRWLSHTLPWGSALRTVQGTPLALHALGTLGDGAWSQPLRPGSDRQAANGVLHCVDDVLSAPSG